MSGVALCQLPDGHCDRCEELFPIEDLEPPHRDALVFYCPACLLKAQQASDEARDRWVYG
jgi:hypothetical protein